MKGISYDDKEFVEKNNRIAQRAIQQLRVPQEAVVEMLPPDDATPFWLLVATRIIVKGDDNE